MGVTGLWKLIEPCGKPVPVETLEGKILAVDISIWLHQVVKGFQDNKGSALANAHLLGLFHRLCKLLYYRVKPVFVFDGCVPQLKRDTIARRQQQRSKLNNEADRIQALLLQSLAKEKVVQQALGVNAELLLKSPLKRPVGKGARADKDIDDIFKLPELPGAVENRTAHERNTDNDYESDYNDASFTDGCSSATTSMDDSSFDESNPRHAYNTNLQTIDVRSHHFRELPADVRHEILVDIKETRKQSSWGRLHELPSRSDDFSTFQMKRLLKRRAVQESLEEAEQEMGGRTLTYAELNQFFTEEGIVEPSAIEKGANQISSDENTRFLLVRDLKKKLSKVDEEIDVKEEKQQEKSEQQVKSAKVEEGRKEIVDNDAPSTSTQAALKVATVVEESSNKFGDEYDADLAMAIALSLETAETNVYRERDYDFESNEALKLNREQRKHLKNAAIGPARAYMIEYGGLNEDEVVNIMDKTQVPPEYEDVEVMDESTRNIIEKPSIEATEINAEAKAVDLICENKNSLDQQIGNASSLETNVVSMKQTNEDSDTDSDLEEVPLDTTETEGHKKSLEIVLNLNEEITPQDDLFADVFECSSTEQKLEKQQNDASIETEKETKSKAENKNSSTTNELPMPQIAKVIPNLKAQSILDELKKQLDEVPKINLDDVKINATIIELSDEEDSTTKVSAVKAEQKLCKSEIIEICDSDDQLPQSTQTAMATQLKTPTKSKAISDFFSVDYVIKRTPEKNNSTEKESPVPKVKSPFFVKKTPKSNRKRAANDDSNDTAALPEEKISKAAKVLFGNVHTDVPTPAVEPQTTENVVEDEKKQAEIQKPLDAEIVIKEAAEVLKEHKTTEELKMIANELAQERRDLESERNRQDRMGMSISQRMNSDCQELLRLFGIPYIVAPMEAEAQCAFLDYVQLTHGTITDDSDIWLFGGRTVYKNFFAQNKHVLEFRAEQIEKLFQCDRQKLIQLACLVGSDYTMGIHGIGAVTALEILATFANSKDANSIDAETTIASIHATLGKFRDWWMASKTTAAPPGTSARLALRKKLKNIELFEGFPSSSVIEAYLMPQVDDSKDAFSWGTPDIESLREFARKTFGWTITKTNDILMPVIKRISEKRTQASIQNYFSVKGALAKQQVKVSKRVQGAIDRMSGKINETLEEATPKTSARSKRTKRKQASKSATSETSADQEESSNIDTCATQVASTSDSLNAKLRKRAVNLPQTKEIIPQREVRQQEMREKRAKAAAVFKNAKTKSK